MATDDLKRKALEHAAINKDLAEMKKVVLGSKDVYTPEEKDAFMSIFSLMEKISVHFNLEVVYLINSKTNNVKDAISGAKHIEGAFKAANLTNTVRDPKLPPTPKDTSDQEALRAFYSEFISEVHQWIYSSLEVLTLQIARDAQNRTISSTQIRKIKEHIDASAKIFDKIAGK